MEIVCVTADDRGIGQVLPADAAGCSSHHCPVNSPPRITDLPEFTGAAPGDVTYCLAQLPIAVGIVVMSVLTMLATRGCERCVKRNTGPNSARQPGSG